MSNFNITSLSLTYTYSSAFFVARANNEVGADLQPSKEVVGQNAYATKTKEELGSKS